MTVMDMVLPTVLAGVQVGVIVTPPEGAPQRRGVIKFWMAVVVQEVEVHNVKLVVL